MLLRSKHKKFLYFNTLFEHTFKIHFLKKLLASLRFLFRQRLGVSSDLVDTKIKNFSYTVEIADVLKYSDAVKNNTQQPSSKNNNTFLHPLYYTKISWQIIENLNKFLEKTIADKILKTIIHQSEYIIFHSELKLPALLTVVSKIWSVQSHKKGTKIVIRFDYYADNEPIATEYSGGLLFGVKCIGEGKDLGEISNSEKIDEKILWEEKITIDELLPYEYAEKDLGIGTHHHGLHPNLDPCHTSSPRKASARAILTRWPIRSATR